MGAPLVKNGVLRSLGYLLNSSEWIEWLESASSFRFESNVGGFTATRRGKGKKYWYANRRARNKLYSVSLGTSEKIDEQRCLEVAAKIDNMVRADIPEGERSPQELKIAQLEEENAQLKQEVQKLRNQLKSVA